ncbi:dipeptidase [Gordonia lacunae]|uniref:dipeptidase n=1 Tax=Gordonia lacunae TaxID=417102 RepID=UPI0039E4EC4E
MPHQQWNPSPEQSDHALRLVHQSMVIDLHAHPQAIMPKFVRRTAEKRLGLPHDPLDNLPAAGINYAVVTAVGDRLGTGWRVGKSPMAAVEAQLTAATVEARLITEPTNTCAGTTRIILGVEGADFLGHDLTRLHDLHQRGVRLVGLMHYADNALGTIATTITGRERARDRRRGLTTFGREFLGELNHLGMVADLAHADKDTTITACEVSTKPVIASHTAALAVRDFRRYISDEEIHAIAATGGLIGLWPASMRGKAMRDLDDFARHASHIAELVGVAHLAVGTDKNGVPDYADGYTASPDMINLAAALLKHGFDDNDVVAILGGNAHRVLQQQPDDAPPSPPTHNEHTLRSDGTDCE